nr:MAG TPA: hypothetical protein [Caudoviricetes sp.]DAG10320.1 MAG TPA: hypothetical protein [Caudoviricetes sp.]
MSHAKGNCFIRYVEFCGQRCPRVPCPVGGEFGK